MVTPDPQPAKALLALRRISNRALARHVGASPGWVGRVLNGWVEPSPDFRRRTSEVLGVPEWQLFRPAAEADRHPGDRALGQAS